MGIDDGGVVFAGEIVEALVLEAVVPHFQRMSSTSPCVTKRCTDSPASDSTRRLVQKREAFAAKTKPSGVSSRHLAQLALLREIVGMERPAPRLERPAADADVDLACHGCLPNRIRYHPEPRAA